MADMCQWLDYFGMISWRNFCLRRSGETLRAFGSTTGSSRVDVDTESIFHPSKLIIYCDWRGGQSRGTSDIALPVMSKKENRKLPRNGRSRSYESPAGGRPRSSAAKSGHHPD